MIDKAANNPIKSDLHFRCVTVCQEEPISVHAAQEKRIGPSGIGLQAGFQNASGRSVERLLS